MTLPSPQRLKELNNKPITPINLNQASRLAGKLSELGIDTDKYWQVIEGMDLGKYNFLYAMACKNEKQIIEEDLQELMK